MKSTGIALLASGGIVLGCADAAAPSGDHALQVQVRVLGQSSTSFAPPGTATNAVTVDIQGVAFALGGLKLETAGLDGTVDWVFDQSAVVPLDLTGDAVLVFDADVPAGVYKELEVSVDKLEIGNRHEESLIDAWPDLADASVLVTGTATPDGGAPETFTFTAALDIDLELVFDEPLRFTGEGGPVTVVSLTIDLNGWFMGTDAVLHPADPANRSAIESNIQASVELHQAR